MRLRRPQFSCDGDTVVRYFSRNCSPRGSTTALSRVGTGSQRCQSPQALIRIVPTLLAGDGEMESDRGYDLTRSQPHE